MAICPPERQVVTIDLAKGIKHATTSEHQLIRILKASCAIRKIGCGDTVNKHSSYFIGPQPSDWPLREEEYKRKGSEIHVLTPRLTQVFREVLIKLLRSAYGVLIDGGQSKEIRSVPGAVFMGMLANLSVLFEAPGYKYKHLGKFTRRCF
jgi:hypothetical protein